jgi:predicted Zn-dependent protease
LQKAQPGQTTGYLLEADAEFARGRPEAAAAVLRKALQLGAGSEAAIKLHVALLAAGRKDDAEHLSTTWKKDHPRDAVFRYHLGDTALARNDLPAAEAHYRSVLEAQPENALALNNIAWLLIRQNKPGAVALAEQANKLMPEQPALMDTLAYALALENQLPRAVALQKQAIAKAPENASLRLTLAKIYLKAGASKQARAELEYLARLGDKFRPQEEVADLMKKL